MNKATPEQKKQEELAFNARLAEILKEHTGKTTTPEDPDTLQETLNEYGRNIRDLTQRVEILEENSTNRRKM